MWPEPGSGFEASPLSPAGVAEGRWRAVRQKRTPTERERLYATIAGAVVVGLVLATAIGSAIVHLLT